MGFIQFKRFPIEKKVGNKLKINFQKRRLFYDILRSGKVQNLQYLFYLCTNRNFFKLLTRIILDREHLMKLFDIRILISLISRDLRGSTSHISFIFLVLFFISSTLKYGLNNKGSVETKHLLLSKIVHERISRSECKHKMQEKYFKPFTYLDIFLHQSFISSKGSKKYINHVSNSEKSVVSTGHEIGKWPVNMLVSDQIEVRGLPKYVIEFLFSKKQVVIDHFTKSICYAFSDILSMDELDVSLHTTEKRNKNKNNKNDDDNKKNSGFKKKYQNFFVKYYIRSDSNRIVDVLNVRNKFKNNFCLNCFVLSDAGFYTIWGKTLNINNLDLIIFMNWNIYRNIYIYLRSISYKCTRHNIFHFFLKNKEVLVIKINYFHFSITKYNRVSGGNESLINIRPVTFFDCVAKNENGTSNWYKSIINIKQIILTHSIKSLNNSFLMHESIHYLKYRIQKLKKDLNCITSNTINQHSCTWVRDVIKTFDFYKDNKYVNWNLFHKWFDRTNNNLENYQKRILIYDDNYSNVMSIKYNRMEFCTNRRILMSWFEKLKKNYFKFYFICQNFIKKGFNFSVHDKSENSNMSGYSPEIIHTRSIDFELNLSFNNELTQELECSSDEELIVLLSSSETLVNKFTIDSFYNKFNIDVDYIKLFDETTLSAIFEKNQDIWFDPVKLSNKSKSLSETYFEAIIPKFLDYLHHIQLSSSRRWFFYFRNTRKNIIKNYKLTYGQLLSISPQHNNIFLLSFVPSYPEKNTISVTQSRISNISSRYLEKKNNQQIFALVNNSYKLFNLLTRINVLFCEKRNTYFIEEFSTRILFTRKQIKLEITCYNQPDLEISTLVLEKKKVHDEKALSPGLSFIQRQSYQHDVFSESPSRIRDQNNKMFELFVGKKGSTGERVIGGENTQFVSFYNSNLFKEIKENETILSFFSPHSDGGTGTFQTSQIDSFLKKNALLKTYMSWFFTFEWWKNLSNIILQTFMEISLNSSDQIEYIYRVYAQDQEISNIQPKKSLLEFIWSYFNLINFWNNEYSIIIIFSLFSYLLIQNYLADLIGSNYIDLWKRFEIIRFFIKHQSSMMYRRHPVQLFDTQNTFINFIKTFLHYLKNRKLFLFIIEKSKRLLASNKSLDIFPRRRELLIQSIITPRNIFRYGLKFNHNHYLLNNEFGYQITQQGLYYLRYVSESFEKSLVNYPFYQIQLAQKWIFLAFWQRITSPHISRQIKTLDFAPNGIPIPLHLGLSPARGNLLVGPIETGQSYLIKNLAADSYVPLIQISISRLLYSEPDITINDGNVLMENLHQLALILELTKEMSPCIVWIQNIHELNANYSTRYIKTNATPLLGLLLRYFRTNLVDNRTFSMIVFGSTHIPEGLDPSLIYPNRLDRLMNIRMLNISQREKEFSILLRSKCFHLENKLSCLGEFGYRTKGYDTRDLALLANEVSLINTTYDKSVIYGDTVELAFYRQILGVTHTGTNTGYSQNDEKLIYEIGNTIVQNRVTTGFIMNPLCKDNNLWKKRFYYLSKWYLEPPIVETTTKEFTILSHILGCLAGSAARDSWFRLKNKRENLISLDKKTEDDSNLARTMLESLLVEFPRLEIYQDELIYNEEKVFVPPYSQTTNLLNIVQNNIFPIQYKQKLYELVSNTAYSPRIWRFSLIRSNIFDRIKRPNEFRNPYYYVGSFVENEQTPHEYLQHNSRGAQFVHYKMGQQSPYDRVLSKMRRRNLQELESQLETTLLKEQSETLGGFSPIQYPMEYQIFNKPLLFLGKRFVWNPTSLLLKNRYLAFSHRNLFVDEEMLRRLYVTYGTKREQIKSQSIQKIKQFFVHRGYSQDSMSNLNRSGLNQLLTFADERNVETFKGTEQIGVQLKHPHLFAAIYLYQPWVVEYPQEKSVRYESLNNYQRWLRMNSLLSSDFSLHSTLFDSYQYLLNSFHFNRNLLNQIIKLFLKNRWFFQNEIETSLVSSNRNL